ncbi:MAG: hypothetical protein ACTSP4_01385 [Candidatus Hodarchaeales archaeon]
MNDNYLDRIRNLEKQQGSINIRIADILEKKLVKVDIAIQKQLESFLARVKLQNDKIKQRLTILEKEISALHDGTVINLGEESGGVDVNQIEYIINELREEKNREMSGFQAKLDQIASRLDSAINEMKTYIDSKLGIDEKMAIFDNELVDEPLEGYINDKAIEGAVKKHLEPLMNKLTTLEMKIAGYPAASGTAGKSDYEDRITAIENQLIELTVANAKKKALKLDKDSLITNYEQLTGTDIIDEDDLEIGDTAETKLEFYEKMVIDLMDKLQATIKKVAILEDEARKKGSPLELSIEQRELQQKLLTFQQENMELKKRIEEKNRQIEEIDERLFSKDSVELRDHLLEKNHQIIELETRLNRYFDQAKASLFMNSWIRNILSESERGLIFIKLLNEAPIYYENLAESVSIDENVLRSIIDHFVRQKIISFDEQTGVIELTALARVAKRDMAEQEERVSKAGQIDSKDRFVSRRFTKANIDDLKKYND